MAAQGTAVVDFGAFPGAASASVTVTGQTGIGAGSLVEAWVWPAATADHTVGEHLVEQLRVVAHTITPGVGFVIDAQCTATLPEGLTASGPGAPGVATTVERSIGASPPTIGGLLPRLYGQWNIAFVWN
jgi:hypothetical protein